MSISDRDDSVTRGPKAIETRYAGCHFRSRLEARWAVFFDVLGIEWQYEPEGFELPSGWYLPDFLVGREGALRAWIEIKGQEPTEREMALASELSARSHFTCVFHGDIPRSADEARIPGISFSGGRSGSSPNWTALTYSPRTDPCAFPGFDDRRRADGWGAAWAWGCRQVDVWVQRALDAARSARFEFGANG